MPLGEFGEDFFVLHQDGANNRGIVRPPELGIAVGDQVKLAVSVDEGEGGARNGNVRNVRVSAFSEVLDDVGEEFELFDQVWILGGVDLGKLDFEERKLFVH